VGRNSAKGLTPGVRIRVRGTTLRAPDRGSVIEVIETAKGPYVRYRSDRNGGEYLAPLGGVAVQRKPHMPKRHETGSEVATSG
jgi:hypothetical protein